MKEKGEKQARARWIAGTMSGTSLDGIDVALVQTDGETISAFGRSAYRPYSQAEREVLQAALGKWPGDDGVAEAGALVTHAHADLMEQFPEADLIGFHGQTLAHDPGGRGTHQTGDGAQLAALTGRPVIWDFRTADVAAGGQGAPFAPAYHSALARHCDAQRPLVILNLGGVGNLTWINPASQDAFAPGAMMAFDTGPANAPLNDLMQQRCGESFDRDGVLAATGAPDVGILAELDRHPYLSAPPPKSLDRDDFRDLAVAVDALPDADAAATLTAAVALTVARGIRLCPISPERVLVTGGGRRNPTLMAALAMHLDCAVGPIEDIGFDGDMLEAQAFAYLAARSLRRLPLSGPTTTGVGAPLSGGRVSHPKEAKVQ